MLQMNALNRIGRNGSRLYAGLALDMDLQFQAPLPAGAKIIAANHPTTTDPVLMMGLLDEPIHILITNMCFQMPVLGRFLRGAGHIPVVTGSGRAAFEVAVALLNEGKTVGIFPEGALSPLDGGACPVHTGVARLALAGGAPVVPAGIALRPEHILYKEARGGDDVQTARIYFGGPYAVTMGQPMYLHGNIEDWGYVQKISQRITDTIMGLAQVSALRMRTATSETNRGALYPAFGRV